MQARLEKLEAGIYTGATGHVTKEFFPTQQSRTPRSRSKASPAFKEAFDRKEEVSDLQ
jgi:hypothetical protein